MKLKLAQANGKIRHKLTRIEGDINCFTAEVEDVTPTIGEAGTILTNEIINSINWKDDKDISFTELREEVDLMTLAEEGKTKIVTTVEGKVYLVRYNQPLCLLNGNYALKQDVPTFSFTNGTLTITLNN